MKATRLSLTLITLFSLIGAAPGALAKEMATWKHTSFDDFQSGTPGNSGHNLYVSRDGRIRSIRRFDLNQNGYIDLAYNNTHDWYHAIPAALASIDPETGKIRESSIPVTGSQYAVLRDLNQDGHPDLVFQPNRSNMRHPRNFVTIAWGDEAGWPAHRIGRHLGTYGATSVAVADLNRDSWPDIITLNGKAWVHGQPSGRILRIYWGARDGYRITRFTDIGAGAAMAMTVGDFDGSGYEDLAVTEKDGTVTVFWNTPGAGDTPEPESGRFETPDPDVQVNTMVTLPGMDSRADQVLLGTASGNLIQRSFHGRSNSSTQRTPAFTGNHLAVGDLDGDGLPDLIFTSLELAEAAGGEAVGATEDAESSINVLWGTPKGFSRQNSYSHPIEQAIGTAVGDFNGDGNPDLAVAVHQGETIMEAQSLFLLGKGDRQFHRAPGGVTTKGAMNPIVVPGEEGNPDRVLFNNTLGGTLNEAVPIDVYWGARDGFSPERRWEIPIHSAYKALAADLTANGHVDLVVLNSRHGSVGPYDREAEAEKTVGAHVYWGEKTGSTPGPNKFKEGRRTILRDPNLGASNVADLNKDGYLDLVFGQFESRESETADLTIYYGSDTGYSDKNRVVHKNKNRTNGTLIADFDRDGWLDIGLIAYQANEVTLLFGGPRGYSGERSRKFHFPSPIDIETADLNGDGWLDLMISSFNDPVSKNRDLGFAIYWGSPEGYQHWNVQWLPGWTPIGLAVADLDDDGHLDLVSPNYHAELNREAISSYIYWGAPDGYSPNNQTSLLVDSAHDVVIADFDGNGLLDLAFSAHSGNHTHRINSPVYFNDGKRFRHAEVQYLPTRGTHYMYSQDIGNIADRSLEEHYKSAELQWDGAAKKGRIHADAEIPDGTSLQFYIRSAPDSDSLGKADWKPVENGSFRIDSRDRILQYKARFLSPNGDRFPILDTVTVSLSSR